MSFINITAKAQTAGKTYSPSAGKKWIIEMVYIQLITGTTAGSRVMTAYIKRSDGTLSGYYNGEQLAGGTSESGTDTTYSWGLAATGILFTQTGATTKYSGIVVDTSDQLVIAGTLQSGDTMNWLFKVDEVIDE